MKITINRINKSIFFHIRNIQLFKKIFSYHFYIGSRGIFGFFSE